MALKERNFPVKITSEDLERDIDNEDSFYAIKIDIQKHELVREQYKQLQKMNYDNISNFLMRFHYSACNQMVEFVEVALTELSAMFASSIFETAISSGIGEEYKLTNNVMDTIKDNITMTLIAKPILDYQPIPSKFYRKLKRANRVDAGVLIMEFFACTIGTNLSIILNGQQEYLLINSSEEANTNILKSINSDLGKETRLTIGDIKSAMASSIKINPKVIKAGVEDKEGNKLSLGTLYKKYGGFYNER